MFNNQNLNVMLYSERDLNAIFYAIEGYERERKENLYAIKRFPSENSSECTDYVENIYKNKMARAYQEIENICPNYENADNLVDRMLDDTHQIVLVKSNLIDSVLFLLRYNGISYTNIRMISHDCGNTYLVSAQY